jgi:hypothetical protein
VVPNEVPASLAGALLAMTQLAPSDRLSAQRAAARLSGGATSPLAPPPGHRAGPAQLVALGLPVLVLLALIAVALLGHHRDLSTDADAHAAAPPAATATGPTPAAPTPAAPTPAVQAPATPVPATGAAPAQPALSVPGGSTPYPSAVTNKVKDTVTHTITDKVKSNWQRFTAWLNSLF